MGAGKAITKRCTKCGEEKNLREGFRENRKDRTWPDICRECQGPRRYANEESVKDKRGMRSVKVNCHSGCGETIIIQVEEGTKAPPIFCTRCKEDGPPAERGGFSASRIREACRQIKPEPRDITDVVVYKPGTEAFRRVAAEVTPVGQVRPVCSMTAPGEASSNRMIV